MITDVQEMIATLTASLTRARIRKAASRGMPLLRGGLRRARREAEQQATMVVHSFRLHRQPEAV